MSTKGNESLADECPKCGAMSYRGGYCFKCGTFRPAKRDHTLAVDDLDTTEFMERSFGTRLTGIPETEEHLNDHHKALKLRKSHSPFKKPQSWKSVVIAESNTAQATLLVQAVVETYGSTSEGQLVQAIEIPWRTIVERLKQNWSEAFSLSSRLWEELIAAAFDADGYDEVTLTPRSGDYGRDVIAVKHGFGCIRIVDSVKAYKPGHLVRHDDVRALAGVLAGDPKASKGILTTTSDFAPSITTDPFVAPLMPFRLELMNGTKLKEWLSNLQ